jgi:hypothetical protein
MRIGFLGFAAAAVAMLTVAVGTAFAATGESLFGDAEYVSPGNASPRAVQIRSDADPGFGGIAFVVPAGTTFGSLDVLSTDFMPQDALDLCTLGSPRFQIGIDTDGDGDRDGTIFTYFGIDSAGAPCVPGWQNTGDFLETGRLLDTSQLPGGTFYDPYTSALAKYGSLRVTSISVVVDSGFAHPDGEQTFVIDNTNVDGAVYTYETPQPSSKDDCKDGGWMNLADDDGNPFKNQGDCVSYANANG